MELTLAQFQMKLAKCLNLLNSKSTVRYIREDLGNECLRSRVNGIFLIILEPPVLTPMSFGQDVINEGDHGMLLCSVVRGDAPYSFTWSLHGDIVHTEPGLTTNQIGGRASMLSISSIGHRHSGLYTCTVKNSAGQTSVSTELKVNGLFARKKEVRKEV